MRAVVFDLDETLIHSVTDFKKMKEQIIDYLQSKGIAAGLLNDRMLNFEIINLATENLRKEGLSEKQIQRILSRVTDIMNQVELQSLGEATVIEGALETLEASKKKGLKIGIITNSCREYTEKILSKFGLANYVDAVAARTDVTRPKPNPEHALYILSLLGVLPEETVLVGDHWLDAECARKTGLKFILVGKHHMDAETLKGYDYEVAQNIVDIVDMVQTCKH